MDHINIHLISGIFESETVMVFVTSIQACIEKIIYDYKSEYLKKANSNPKINVDDLETAFFNYVKNLLNVRKDILQQYVKELSSELNEETYYHLINTYIKTITSDMEYKKAECNAPGMEDFIYCTIRVLLNHTVTDVNNIYMLLNDIEKLATTLFSIRESLRHFVYKKIIFSKD